MWCTSWMRNPRLPAGWWTLGFPRFAPILKGEIVRSRGHCTPWHVCGRRHPPNRDNFFKAGSPVRFWSNGQGVNEPHEPKFWLLQLLTIFRKKYAAEMREFQKVVGQIRINILENLLDHWSSIITNRSAHYHFENLKYWHLPWWWCGHEIDT